MYDAMKVLLRGDLIKST